MIHRSLSAARDVLEEHDVFVGSDNEWQRRARLSQSLWRQRNGFEAGLHQGRPLGSRLREAEGLPPRMANYMTENIRVAVHHALSTRQPGALFAEPRLWTDLLSSQPLCFNLFGELTADLELATRVFGSLLSERVGVVESIRFEWSPGRGDPKYLANKSAFDVFVTYRGSRGRGFVALEVKYHENLRGKAAAASERYRTVARMQGLFSEGDFDRLERLPLQQLWLDHLLALQMLSVDGRQWQEGIFVVLHPARNQRCADAVVAYRGLLHESATFDAITLERLLVPCD